MKYELCLEYGCFPVKAVPTDYLTAKDIPDFLQGDTELVAQLEALNALFQSLFHTVECKFDYMGGQYPERIAEIKRCYPDIAESLISKYGQTVEITVESLLI